MYEFTTQKQIRAAFWQGFTHLNSHYKCGLSQNQYSATIRTEFVEFIDMLQKDAIISESLANKTTL
tara:strand:+ start:473 stop:670 length:198 start_codon:yes stop_codon:yes gene_type:complete